MARVLFVEPFYGGSHRAFTDELRAHSRHDIDILALPGERWRQRMRLGAQLLVRKLHEHPGDYALLIASDMLDLPAFLALARPRFADTPVLLYMHENQFTYPRIRGTRLNSWFGQINYLSALAADFVAFNSEYHRHDFLDALRTLADTPTNWLDPAAIDEIAAKSTVLPVGVDLRRFDGQRPERTRQGPPLVLWNHRWEFDKAPATFARVITQLAAEDIPFEAAIAGSPGDNPDPAMARLQEAIPDRIVHFGHCDDREAYARLLWDATVTVSTARHEFFGIGTVEAMYCGCVPLAPAGLNYPALIPEALHGRCLFENEDQLRDRLRALLQQADLSRDARAVRDAAARYDWAIAGGEWDAAIEGAARTEQ